MEGKKEASQQVPFFSLCNCSNFEFANKNRRVKPLQTLLPAESHFFHKRGVVGLVVVDQDADGTGRQGEGQSAHDASIWYGSLQLIGPSGEDVEQQRHHSQGGNTGARRHDNAGI